VTADDRPSWGQKWGQPRPEARRQLAIGRDTAQVRDRWSL